MSFTNYIGIDPGTKGAIAVLDAEGRLLSMADAKSTDELGVPAIEPVLQAAVAAGSVLAVVERPLAFPGIPAQAQVTLALAAGSAMGLARASGAQVEFPTPAQWKKAMGLSKDKKASVAKAIELFGADAVGKARHDRCEAALLAYYGFQKHNQWKIATTL